MDPRSEVVIRQQDYLSGQVLLINAPNDQLAKNLPNKVQASVQEEIVYIRYFAASCIRK